MVSLDREAQYLFPSKSVNASEPTLTGLQETPPTILLKESAETEEMAREVRKRRVEGENRMLEEG